MRRRYPSTLLLELHHAGEHHADDDESNRQSAGDEWLGGGLPLIAVGLSVSRMRRGPMVTGPRHANQLANSQFCDIATYPTKRLGAEKMLTWSEGGRSVTGGNYNRLWEAPKIWLLRSVRFDVAK